MPQQRRIRVKTSGSPEHENERVVITVSDEDAAKLDGLDLWVKKEKEATHDRQRPLRAPLSPTSATDEYARDGSVALPLGRVGG